jgi:hypothetical protein
MKALLVVLVFMALSGCSSETLGYIDKAKFDANEKKIVELQKQLADANEKLATNQKSLSELQAHKYSMFQNGNRTWRLNTVTGDACIALTSNADWKRKETKEQSCACTDLFEPTRFKPSDTLMNVYCGIEYPESASK